MTATNSRMLAMVMEKPGAALALRELPVPVPETGQVLIQVIACGICRTDLHILDGELPHPKLPLIPGHEIVGTVLATGPGVSQFVPGDHVGVPWLGYTCGICRYCRAGRENLCENALFTGYTINGGFATHTVAWEKYCFLMPPMYANSAGAPLLCAGLIGYRSYRMLPPGARKIALYGFGAAAHIQAQTATYEGREIYAFTKPGDKAAQRFALAQGACWAGDAGDTPPAIMDAAIIFAPDGGLVPSALAVTDKGGVVICAGIHMSDIPGFPYQLLWGERVVRSVANLTREDGDSFLRLAPRVPIKTSTTAFALQDANKAIAMFRAGQIRGAAVLDIMPNNL